MKPYPGKNLTRDKKNFNIRLSRARATVECGFGRLCQKWRIFYTTIQQLPAKAAFITKGACILHNVLTDKEGTSIHASPCKFDKTKTAFVQAECEDVTKRGQQVRRIMTQYLIERKY